MHHCARTSTGPGMWAGPFATCTAMARIAVPPTAVEVLDECRAAGRTLAEKAKEMASNRKAGVKLCVDP